MSDYLTLIESASTQFSEEIDWIKGIALIVDILEEASNLSEEHIAILIGIGALMYRQEFHEVLANLRSFSTMKQVKGG